MGEGMGAVISIGSCLGFLAVLLGAYIPKSIRDINLYYNSGVVNVLFAGILAAGVIVVFATSLGNYISREFGAGIMIGLGVFIVLVSVAWAVTRRVDVFRAPTWAFPAQRWVLVVLSVLIVFGAGWYAWTLDVVPRGR